MAWAIGSANQLAVIASVGTSALGCSIVMLIVARFPRLRQFPARLTAYLIAVNWVWFCTALVGMLDERDLCAILGPIDMLCALMSIAWTCVMSLHVGILLAASDPTEVQSKEWRYHAFVWIVPGIMVAIAILYSRSTFQKTESGVCYVDIDLIWLRIATDSAPSIVGFLFNLCAYTWAIRKARSVHRRAVSGGGTFYHGADPARLQLVERVVSNASKYLLVYLVCWSTAVIEDVYFLMNRTPPPSWAWAIMASLFFAQGALNSIVYVVHKWHLIRTLCCSPAGSVEGDDRAASLLDWRRRSSIAGMGDRTGSAELSVSKLNMALAHHEASQRQSFDYAAPGHVRSEGSFTQPHGFEPVYGRASFGAGHEHDYY